MTQTIEECEHDELLILKAPDGGVSPYARAAHAPDEDGDLPEEGCRARSRYGDPDRWLLRPPEQIPERFHLCRDCDPTYDSSQNGAQRTPQDVLRENGFDDVDWNRQKVACRDRDERGKFV